MWARSSPRASSQERSAGSFFANPYAVVPPPAGLACLPRVSDGTGIAVTNTPDVLTDATADLTTTVRHIRQLIATGGLLVMLEVGQKVPYLDLIFGITDGFNDESPRGRMLFKAGILIFIVSGLVLTYHFFKLI